MKYLSTFSGIGGFELGINKAYEQIRSICERLQGLPGNYTEGVSNTQRYKALGNAFNVDVVAHIIRTMI